MMSQTTTTPVHCDSPMWRVINRRTAVNALSREHDTLVWECSICGEIAGEDREAMPVAAHSVNCYLTDSKCRMCAHKA